MNNYTLYMHRNKYNGKVYIGITRQSPASKRWAAGRGYINNKHFNQAIQKYGWDGFEHLILQENLTQKQACILEKEFIKLYDSLNPNKGYNLADGGIHLGPTSFEKMIEWQNNNKKFGKDNVNSKKVRCIQTGEIFGSIGEAARWCDSTKVGECCRGNRQHAGTHPQTGEKLSWEFILDDEINVENNIIECHQLQNNEYKHLAYSSGKKVLCIETNEIFLCEADACNAYGASRGTIGRACNGKRKTALGKHWKWIE